MKQSRRIKKYNKLRTRKNKKGKNKKIRRRNRSNKRKIRGGNNTVSVVKLWAEWCPHCVTLNVIWKEVIEKVNEKLPNIMFYDIEEKDIPIKLNQLNSELNLKDNNIMTVDGFPTIIKIMNGEIEKYSGNRDVISLVNWITGEQM